LHSVETIGADHWLLEPQPLGDGHLRVALQVQVGHLLAALDDGHLLDLFPGMGVPLSFSVPYGATLQLTARLTQGTMDATVVAAPIPTQD
jgi:hypothetical protein